ncbi:hypothetical protein B0T26DRAFT_679099 [Lasiosphaeria miniovina]|uniref:Uncharacterized protein n=1 Tax=Lasiosphaeria miniovina TaxID=1954250 RepID=A0AA40A5M5_9PEZI|nr:uncharacterized protein B0T26DRAFT_679099 [Lasiosphaeria miniovina]KAK0709724.1 hypothetical protein B0T26DRAFT_679099 [Lasiosphaeria miniovina]
MSVHSRSSSSGSEWTRSPSRASGASTRYRDQRIPNTPAVNALLYFCCRNPKKVKSVRVYETTYDDDFETRSNASSWSSWSSGKKNLEAYFIESRGMYYYADQGSQSPKKPKKPSSSNGRGSRSSSHRSGAPGPDPWTKGRPNQAHVSSEDEEDFDDGSSDGSFVEEDFAYQGGGGGGPFPGPGMMPPYHGGPPPGAFQPVYGGGPGGPPPFHQFHHQPPPPPHGFPPRMAGPVPPMPGPPPPQADGHFVRDPNGIQVFTG